MFYNHNLTDVITPINAVALKSALNEIGYDKDKTEFLINGFTHGFDLGYRGPGHRTDYSDNIPLRLGTKTDLWNKIMKEVELGRYAGPFEKPPYDNFMQSPVGLVPKSGNKTRLIFHLSYDFGPENRSFNFHTPLELCTVQYHDLDHAVCNCLRPLEQHPDCEVIFFSKSDLSSAFRQLPGHKRFYRWLLMKAQCPLDGRWYFFVDKCVPFGASISCTLFQKFSDALHAIIEYRTRKNGTTNYLDDFLFAAITRLLCNAMAQKFIDLCMEINCPISHDKTEWASEMIVFLGILLDGRRRVLVVPEEKKNKALNMLHSMLLRKKTTVKDIQCLTGLLNFIGKAIIPGRAFTRQMYQKLKLTNAQGKVLKRHHHVNIDRKFKEDCQIWIQFLQLSEAQVLCRPFTDAEAFKTAQEIDFYTDSSQSRTKGFGCVYKEKYTWGIWGSFIQMCEPSIEYLELYALTMGILIWEQHLANTKIIVFCDNQAVVHMVNNTSSSCPNCLYLIRVLVLNGLIFNRRLSVRYVPTKLNARSDALSRLQFDRFFRLSPQSRNVKPEKLSNLIWPPEKIWIKETKL